jgi:hypothetical protein
MYKKNLYVVILPPQMLVSMPQRIFVMMRPNFPLNSLTISIKPRPQVHHQLYSLEEHGLREMLMPQFILSIRKALLFCTEMINLFKGITIYSTKHW